jgi:hypothetical protein
VKLAPAWSHPIAVADLLLEGSEFELTPTDEERAALANYVGVLAVPTLIAKFKVTPDSSGGASVIGRLEGTVRQNCIVSLELFDNGVREDIAVRFVPEGTEVSVTDDGAELGEEDPQDIIKNGKLDLGALVSEFLALGIDPYPRRPGAVFTPAAEEQTDEGSSAFAVLAKLKEKGRQVD